MNTNSTRNWAIARNANGMWVMVGAASMTFMLAFTLSGVAHAGDPQFTAWSAPVNLGPVVNSNAIEGSPQLSRDGLSLYFSSDRPLGSNNFDLWVSRRDCRSCPWQDPVTLGPNINTAGEEASLALSPDGHLLFFSSDRPGGFDDTDIWVSFRWNTHDDFGWVPPVNLGASVNTIHHEFGPAFLPGKSIFGKPTFYFTRTEPTEQDIFETRLTRRGAVSAPVTEINAPVDLDGGPSFRGDGKELVFFSDRADGAVGGVDIWSATRPHASAPWSPPVNLGSPVNTIRAEIGVGMSFDGTELYIVKGQQLGGSGLRDLWVSTRERIDDD